MSVINIVIPIACDFAGAGVGYAIAWSKFKGFQDRKPKMNQYDRKRLRVNAAAEVIDRNEEMTKEILLRDQNFKRNCYSCRCTVCGWFPTNDDNSQEWFVELNKAHRAVEEHRCEKTNSFMKEKW